MAPRRTRAEGAPQPRPAVVHDCVPPTSSWSWSCGTPSGNCAR